MQKAFFSANEYQEEHKLFHQFYCELSHDHHDLESMTGIKSVWLCIKSQINFFGSHGFPYC